VVADNDDFKSTITTIMFPVGWTSGKLWKKNTTHKAYNIYINYDAFCIGFSEGASFLFRQKCIQYIYMYYTPAYAPCSLTTIIPWMIDNGMIAARS